MMTLLRPLLFFMATAVAVSSAATMQDDTPEGRLLATCMSNNDGDDDIETIWAALKDGADINIKDDASGQTPLMASVLRGKTALVKYLLAKGADASIAEKDGYTPPHGAGFQGRKDIFEILVEQFGVDIVTQVHNDGFTPFHRACWGREARHAETVEYLLQLGVDMDLPGGTNEPKNTCMEMTNNPETKRILEKHAAIKQEL